MKEKIYDLKSNIESYKPFAESEAETKSYFIIPLLEILGYNSKNPNQIRPEFTADTSNKKGTKVDYAIMKDGLPEIIVECKKWQEDISNHIDQLEGYFPFTDAKFAILTNGIEYKFFSDIDSINRMDLKPFFEFSVENISDEQIETLAFFSIEKYNRTENFELAKDLKFKKGIQKAINKEFNEPSDDFIRIIAKQVYSGTLTQTKKEYFRDMIKSILNSKAPIIIEKKIPTPKKEIVKPVKEKPKLETKKNDKINDKFIERKKYNFDINNIPDMRFSKIDDAKIEGNKFKDWNKILRLVYSILLNKGNTIENIKQIVSENFFYKSIENHHHIISETDYYILGQDTFHCISKIIKLSQEYNLSLHIKFHWRDKPEQTKFANMESEIQIN